MCVQDICSLIASVEPSACELLWDISAAVVKYSALIYDLGRTFIYIYVYTHICFESLLIKLQHILKLLHVSSDITLFAALFFPLNAHKSAVLQPTCGVRWGDCLLCRYVKQPYLHESLDFQTPCYSRYC